MPRRFDSHLSPIPSSRYGSSALRPRRLAVLLSGVSALVVMSAVAPPAEAAVRALRE